MYQKARLSDLLGEGGAIAEARYFPSHLTLRWASTHLPGITAEPNAHERVPYAFISYDFNKRNFYHCPFHLPATASLKGTAENPDPVARLASPRYCAAIPILILRKNHVFRQSKRFVNCEASVAHEKALRLHRK